MKNNSRTDVKRQIIAIFACLIHFAVSAQTIQKGVVQEYNEKSKKTALPGVELNVYPAQSTVSGNDGTFQLEFLTLKPGERINVRRIEKAGYEIFNKEALEQWNFNPKTPFFIVMCRSDKFKQLKDLYFRNSEERYNRQYKAAQAELKKLKEQNKIQQEEYIEKLRGIENEYTKQLENLDNYVDRFARIDLSELSAVEQQIIELVQQGKIDEAIVKYEELNASDKLLDNLKKRGEVKSAIEKLSEVDSTLSQANDTLYAVVRRQINTLQLAGGADNNRKIKQLYCEVADADTTNVAWLLETGLFITEYIADYQLAMRYYQSALSSAIAQFGDWDYSVSTCYNNIGAAYYDQGDASKALEYLMKTQEIVEHIFGPDHPNVASVYDNIAQICATQGEYSKSFELQIKALEIRQRTLDPYHPHIALSFNGIGELSAILGDYPNALKAHMMALDILERIHGVNHPDLAISYNNIAQVFAKQGKYSEALEYNNKALEILIHVFGTEHPKVATTYNNLGHILALKGDFSKALELFMESLEMRKRIFGSDNYDVATSYNNVGQIYYELGDYSKALDFYNKSLEIMLHTLGSEHPNVAVCYNNVGQVYNRVGEYSKAMEYYMKSVEMNEKKFGKYHPAVARSYTFIGQVYNNQGEYSKALEYLINGLEIFEHVLEPESPDVAVCYSIIGNVYANQGDYSKSLEHIMKSVKIKERVLGQNHPSVASAYSDIALIYAAQGEYEKSMESFKTALDIYDQLSENESDVVKRANMNYLEALKKCAEKDATYKDRIPEFMADKVWVGTVVDGSPAAAKGMKGEYFILEFGGWRYDKDYDLPATVSALKGKPKKIAVMQDGKVSQHVFDDTVGVVFGVAKVTLAEKEEIARIYRQWKDDGEK